MKFFSFRREDSSKTRLAMDFDPAEIMNLHGMDIFTKVLVEKFSNAIMHELLKDKDFVEKMKRKMLKRAYRKING